MTGQVGVSPGGVGYIRTKPTRLIPDESAAERNARYRRWVPQRGEQEQWIGTADLTSVGAVEIENPISDDARAKLAEVFAEMSRRVAAGLVDVEVLRQISVQLHQTVLASDDLNAIRNAFEKILEQQESDSGTKPPPNPRVQGS